MAVTSLNGKEVALAGRLFSMTRTQVIEAIERAGARHVREPSSSTDLLVVGEAADQLTASGGISRNLRVFRELKGAGAGVRLVEEAELLKMLGAEDELSDFSRLYTAGQVSRIVEAPLREVRAWVRKGLLQPACIANRLAWFEFKDILTARSLSRLTASGVPARQIHESLSEIARWLPDGDRVVGRLEAYAKGLRVMLPDGGWAEPSGQMLMDFQKGENASTARVSPFPRPPREAGTGVEAGVRDAAFWFEQAVEAEEAGRLVEAAEMYSMSLKERPEAETFFNLGNVLYEMGREGEAAERYLQALDADHAFAEAWNNLGNSLVALGKLEDAVHAYELALSLEPGYPDPHCNLATVLERLEKYDGTLAHRGVCREAYPSEAHLTLLRQTTLEAVEE